MKLGTLFSMFIFTLMLTQIVAAQKIAVKIVYTSGDTIVGLGKLKGEYIKYWSFNGGHSKKVNFSEIEYASFRKKTGVETYKSVFVKKKNESIVMQELVKGSVSLYREEGTVMTGGFSGGPMGAPQSYRVIEYYIKKEGENYVQLLTTNSLFGENFKKETRFFFTNCPELDEKIEKKIYKKKNIVEMVNFYNTNCTKESDN